MIASIVQLPARFLRLEKEQWLPYNRIRTLQWRRFKRIIHHAYENTVFYRKQFRNQGITPHDIRDWRDVKFIPIIGRENLRNPEAMIASGYSAENMYRSSSSGSLGKRTTTYFDTDAWLIGKYLLKLRARWACGVRPHDRMAIFSEESYLEARWKNIILRKKRFSILEPAESHVKSLLQYDPTVMYGFPSYFSMLADTDISFRRRIPIFTSSEMLDGSIRKKLGNRFGAMVYDIYGSTELKEISWECPEFSGYHINADWLLVEFLPSVGKESADFSKIVVSSLYNFGMPLIRYEIGDTGRKLNKLCACGRGLPLMTPSHGRSADCFRLPNNTLISPYKMTCAIEHIEGMQQYQIRQKNLHSVTVKVIPNDKFSETSILQIRQKMEKILPETSVQVETVQEIPREKSGKFRIVVSEIASAKKTDYEVSLQ